MPRAAQLLTAEDWAAVASSVVPDPLFGDVVEARFQELRSQLAGGAAKMSIACIVDRDRAI